MDAFASLPPDSRLWVLALTRPAEGRKGEALREGLERILGSWRHKGQAYQAVWELREDRLLLVAEPNMASAPSGCAIDGMMRKVAALAAEAGLGLLGPEHILVRLGGRLQELPRSEIGPALEDGTLGPDTPVVDLSLHDLEQLRSGRLERPLARTWIGRSFKVAATA